MFEVVQQGLAVLLAIFVIYIIYKVTPLIINKYFTPKASPAPPVENFAKYNPAPAVSTGIYPSEPLRTVSASGPNSPNSAPSAKQEQNIVPAETPNDPLAETNKELPIKTDLRQPERMFSPPPPNTGTSQAVKSGISGDTEKAPSPSGKFSQDFLQNGGEFMTGIFANDLSSKGNAYAEI
jgi:hypothetical protein